MELVMERLDQRQWIDKRRFLCNSKCGDVDVVVVGGGVLCVCVCWEEKSGMTPSFQDFGGGMVVRQRTLEELLSEEKKNSTGNTQWDFPVDIIAKMAQGHAIFNSGTKAPNLYSKVLNSMKKSAIIYCASKNKFLWQIQRGL